MQIAIALFPRFTSLDAVGPYEVLTRLPRTDVVFAAERRGPVPNGSGELSLVAEATLDEVTRPDILLMPGGPGVLDQLTEGGARPLVEWVRTVDPHTTWTTSVCAGSLILGAAGLLKGRRATSHWLTLKQLPAYGAQPTLERVVVEGKYVTAAGVSSGLDMALTLAGRIVGGTEAQAIQLAIEYDPQPPYDSGSPTKAPTEVHEAFQARMGQLVLGEPDRPGLTR
jgi:putative intracellular protease/amidase